WNVAGLGISPPSPRILPRARTGYPDFLEAGPLPGPGGTQGRMVPWGAPRKPVGRTRVYGGSGLPSPAADEGEWLGRR
ncbi:unnamed protein product, partial [Musa textilis]